MLSTVDEEKEVCCQARAMERLFDYYEQDYT